MNLTLTLNHHTSTPIYRQIVNQLREMILKGELQDGFALPSEIRYEGAGVPPAAFIFGANYRRISTCDVSIESHRKSTGTQK